MFRTCLVALAVPALVAACGGSTDGAAAQPGTHGSASASASSALESNPGGDIPDTQAFVVYTSSSGGFSVNVPEGWARTENAGVVTFTSHFDSVAVMSAPAAAALTAASASAAEVPALQRQPGRVTIGGVATVTRPAGQAIQITYSADSPPDPVTGHVARLELQRYEFWRNGVEAVVTVAAPLGADNVDPWRTITDSFTWR